SGPERPLPGARRMGTTGAVKRRARGSTPQTGATESSLVEYGQGARGGGTRVARVDAGARRIVLLGGAGAVSCAHADDLDRPRGRPRAGSSLRCCGDSLP